MPAMSYIYAKRFLFSGPDFHLRTDMDKAHRKKTIILCLLPLFAALPAVMLRSMSVNEELAFFSMAEAALSDLHLFAFYENGIPYTENPPLYLWLCMLTQLVSPSLFASTSVMLFINALCYCLMVWALGNTFGTLLQKNYRFASRLASLTVPYLLLNIFLIKPDLLALTLTLTALKFALDRASRIIASPDETVREGTRAIPVLLALAFLCKGFLPLFILPAVMFCCLFLKHRLHLLFKILPLKFFLLPLLAAVLFLLGTFLDGGFILLKAYVLSVVYGVIGLSGHVRNPFFFVYNFAWLSLPVGFCALYTGYRLVRMQRSALSIRMLAAMVLPLITLCLISLPLEKHEESCIYALPSLVYIIIYYVQQAGSRDARVKTFLVLGLSPYMVLFFLYYFLRDDYEVLNNRYIISALLFILLFTALAAFKVMKSSAVDGLSAFACGVFVMLFTLGLAMPDINPYFSPVPALNYIEDEAETSGNSKVCLSGVRNAWTLNNLYEDLEITRVAAGALESPECLKSYRFIGRITLKDQTLKEIYTEDPHAVIFGDSLVLPPQD